jgi:hypothetical protein
MGCFGLGLGLDYLGFEEAKMTDEELEDRLFTYFLARDENATLAEQQVARVGEAQRGGQVAMVERAKLLAANMGTDRARDRHIVPGAS